MVSIGRRKMDKVDFRINGKLRSVEIKGSERLLYVIREKLGLTGTKCGCDDGTCGACMVIVNGEAKRSCMFMVNKIQDTEILTIEGISPGKELHPIQKALIDAGAVQCGFCIPGIVIELYALFNKSKNASDEDIKTALARHLCRCTGYEAIWEGAKLAQKYMSEE